MKKLKYWYLRNIKYRKEVVTLITQQKHEAGSIFTFGHNQQSLCLGNNKFVSVEGVKIYRVIRRKKYCFP